MRERGETIESIAGLAGITAKQVREHLKLMGDAGAEADRRAGQERRGEHDVHHG